MLSLRQIFAMTLACGTLAAGPAVAESGEIHANWQRHEIEFTYMGFTTRYSCGGLRDKMKVLLRHAGARPDYKVSTRACADGPGRVTPFPRVRLVFFAPGVPALGQRELGAPAVARWRPVVFVRRQPRELEVGDCELVEQFRERVLPSFTTRQVSSDIHCIPYQLSGSSFSLRFEVLEGLPEPDAPARKPS